MSGVRIIFSSLCFVHIFGEGMVTPLRPMPVCEVSKILHFCAQPGSGQEYSEFSEAFVQCVQITSKSTRYRGRSVRMSWSA